MNRSDSIAALAAALVDAQAEIEGAAKDKVNPHFRTTYADLASVSDACRPALNRHGIAFVQTPEPGEPGTLCLTTMLLHKSGEWISGTCTMPLPKNDPQGFGSAMTYARRYGLAAMVGVCPEDDDGNGAQQSRSAPAARPAPAKPAPAKPAGMSDAEKFIALLNEAFDARDFTPDQKAAAYASVCKAKKVSRVTDLPADQQAAMLQAVAAGKLDKFKESAATAA